MPSAPRIVFESPRLLREYLSIDGGLRLILYDLLDLWPSPSWDIRVTSIYRTVAEEMAAGGKSGIHRAGPPYRALDLGGRDIGQSACLEIASKVNALWIYDPARPDKQTAFAERHGSGVHIHLQCHTSTRRR